MPVGDRQKVIIDIMGTVLNQKPATDKTFDWFINKHMKEHFDKHFTVIDRIFNALQGDKQANQTKRTMTLD